MIFRKIFTTTEGLCDLLEVLLLLPFLVNAASSTFNLLSHLSATCAGALMKAKPSNFPVLLLLGKSIFHVSRIYDVKLKPKKVPTYLACGQILQILWSICENTFRQKYSWKDNLNVFVTLELRIFSKNALCESKSFFWNQQVNLNFNTDFWCCFTALAYDQYIDKYNGKNWVFAPVKSKKT